MDVRPVETAEGRPQDPDGGENPQEESDEEIDVRRHRRRTKRGAILKRASGPVSEMTTGRVSLCGSGRLEADVDARETAPGSLSRLPGAHPSRRDAGQELRGLRGRRGGGAAPR